MQNGFKNKFKGKFNEKISNDITLSQVELAQKIENVKELLENICSLYTKLFAPSIFTQETS